MKKAQLIVDLLKEARADRGTNAAAKRTVKALRGLGLEQSEIIYVMAWLDYCSFETGEPYNEVITRCW